MPNLHSSHPRRGDNTEEYQVKYHEYMLECFKRHPYMWANYVWNMFDFAADARDQGGEPGMNHKGLVTFDRQIKKDSFYLYKAYWSKEPMVYISGKRFRYRPQKYTVVKVYSNCDTVSLYVDGQLCQRQTGSKIFKFRIPLAGETKVKVVAGDVSDEAVFHFTPNPISSYKLNKKIAGGGNWT
jgi:beta-galactosidase